MESEITPVLELLHEHMKHLDINSSTGGGGVGVGITDLEAFMDKWKGKLNEVAARIHGMYMFAGGRWFRSRMECVDFAESQKPMGQFQRFIEIVSYIQFLTKEMVSTADSQRDEVHVPKARKTKEQSISISYLKTYVPTILE